MLQPVRQPAESALGERGSLGKSSEPIHELDFLRFNVIFHS